MSAFNPKRTSGCLLNEVRLNRYDASSVDPRRATHTISDPLTGDESDGALLCMPFKQARAAAIYPFEERHVLHLLEAPCADRIEACRRGC